MNSSSPLNLLCAGAAQGLVNALAADWLAQAGRHGRAASAPSAR